MRSKHATPLFVAHDRLPPPWMKSIRNVTLAESDARELRRRAYQGSPDEIAVLSELAQRAAE